MWKKRELGEDINIRIRQCWKNYYIKFLACYFILMILIVCLLFRIFEEICEWFEKFYFSLQHINLKIYPIVGGSINEEMVMSMDETIPTVGFNLETFIYRNIKLQVWDVIRKYFLRWSFLINHLPSHVSFSVSQSTISYLFISKNRCGIWQVKLCIELYGEIENERWLIERYGLKNDHSIKIFSFQQPSKIPQFPNLIISFKK